jgi:hypothetical protein
VSPALEETDMARAFHDGVYEEIHLEILSGPHGHQPVTDLIPPTCPACGALLKSRKDVGEAWESVKYDCGGGYSSKPQIQNHHDVWWGKCGNSK